MKTMAPNSRKRTQVSLRTRGIDRTLSISRRSDISNDQRNALRNHHAARYRRINSGVHETNYNTSSLSAAVMMLENADNSDPSSAFRIICENISNFASPLSKELTHEILNIVISLYRREKFPNYFDGLLHEILWILTNLTYRSEWIRARILEELGTLLFEVLSGTDDTLKELSLWCIGNILSSGLESHPTLLSNTLLPRLVDIFRSTNLTLIRLSAWCLGNLLQDPTISETECDTLFHLGIAWVSFVVYTELQQYGISPSSSTAASQADIQAWFHSSFQERWQQYLPSSIDSLILSHWHLNPEKCAFLPIALEFMYTMTRLLAQNTHPSVPNLSDCGELVKLIGYTTQIFWYSRPVSPRSSLTTPISTPVALAPSLPEPTPATLSTRIPHPILDPTPGTTPGVSPLPLNSHPSPTTNTTFRPFDLADFASTTSIADFCKAVAQTSQQTSPSLDAPPPPPSPTPGWMDFPRPNTQGYSSSSAAGTTSPSLSPSLSPRALALAPRIVELLRALATRYSEVRTNVCRTQPILPFLGSVLRSALCHAWQKNTPGTYCIANVSFSVGDLPSDRSHPPSQSVSSGSFPAFPPFSAFPAFASSSTPNASNATSQQTAIPDHVDVPLAHHTLELIRTLAHRCTRNTLHILGAECPPPPPLPSSIQESLSQSPQSSLSSLSPYSPTSPTIHTRYRTLAPMSPLASLATVAHLDSAAFVPLGLLPLLVACLHLPFVVFSSALDCLYTIATVPWTPAHLHPHVPMATAPALEEEHFPFVGILLSQPHLVPSLLKAFTLPDPRTQRTALELAAHVIHAWHPPFHSPDVTSRSGRGDLSQYRREFPTKSDLWFSSLHSLGPSIPGLTCLMEHGLAAALTQLQMEVKMNQGSGREIFSLAETLLEFIHTQTSDGDGYGHMDDLTDTLLVRNSVRETAPQDHFVRPEDAMASEETMDGDVTFSFDLDANSLNITNSFEIFLPNE